MLHAYSRYARAPSVMRYLAVAVLFAAGLMSKPMLVSAPIILLLLDYWPLRRFEQPSLIIGKTKISECDDKRRIIRRLCLEKIPLFLLSAVACILTFILQKRTAGAIPPLPAPTPRARGPYRTAGYAWRGRPRAWVPRRPRTFPPCAIVRRAELPAGVVLDSAL